MQDTTRLCPFCAKELPENVNWCCHCGKDLHGMKLARPKPKLEANLFRIVPDGSLFGIAYGNEIKIHGLDLNRARGLLDILNSVSDVNGTG